MKRRQFIVACGATAVAAIGIGFLRWFRGTFPTGYRRWASPSTLLEIMDEATIAGLGKDYLKAHAGESRTPELTALIVGRDGPNVQEKSRSTGEEDGFLKNKIREDFASGRLVQLDGWLLSETEARQCALFSIVADS